MEGVEYVLGALFLLQGRKMKHYHAIITTSNTVEFLIAAEDVESARAVAVQLKHDKPVDAAVIRLREDSDDNIRIAEVDDTVWEEEKTKREVT